MIFQSSEDIAHAQILISDFGESFFQNEERKDLHTPILLTAPEIFLTSELARLAMCGHSHALSTKISVNGHYLKASCQTKTT
ncbi:hypothetical protein BJX99DRAFT_238225 [Aspergillus californicus]